MGLLNLFRKKKLEPDWSVAAVQAQQGFMAAIDAKREVVAVALKDSDQVFQDLKEAGMPDVYILAFLDGVEKRDKIEKELIGDLAKRYTFTRKQSQ